MAGLGGRTALCILNLDTRAGLGVVAKRKIPASAGNRTPVGQQVAIHFTVELHWRKHGK